MQKIVPTNQVLVDFASKPLKNADDVEFTLKEVLLTYIQNAHMMGIEDSDKTNAYELGFIIGSSTGKVTLSQNQYDALKRIVDSGRITSRGETNDIYPILISQQAKRIVDKAETVEEEK